MALGPYASAEEKRLFNIEEKLDRILAIVLRKTPEDYTRIAREESARVPSRFNPADPANYDPDNRQVHPIIQPGKNFQVFEPELPANIAPTFLSGFTLEPNLEGNESAKAFLDELPDFAKETPEGDVIVPAVVDNAERIDDDIPF